LSKKVFVSYCHAQGDWVWSRLVPCLKAGGAEVLIDRERFVAGKALVGQMDAIQDLANVHLLVLSTDYLKSANCLHEMRRAVACDPAFTKGVIVPVQREVCTLPPEIAGPNPLYVNLVDDGDAHGWKRLLAVCDSDLGVEAPAWLHVRDEIVRFLGRRQSVNLVITGRPKWRELIQHIQEEHLKDLALVNLDRGVTASRPGLVMEILGAFGSQSSVPAPPHDLAELDRVISLRPLSRLALLNFDHVSHRYEDKVDLFSALRFLVMDSRKLVLLAESRTPFAALLPADHPLSQMDLKTVELKGV
jgi:hypothetical protein